MSNYNISSRHTFVYCTYLSKVDKTCFPFPLLPLDHILEASKFIVIATINAIEFELQARNAVERMKRNKVVCQHIVHKTTESTQVLFVINRYTAKRV